MVYLEKKETMRSFASDNNSGVHPDILKSLQDANQDHAIGYGDDPWTQRVEELFKKTLWLAIFGVFNLQRHRKQRHCLAGRDATVSCHLLQSDGSYLGR